MPDGVPFNNNLKRISSCRGWKACHNSSAALFEIPRRNSPRPFAERRRALNPLMDGTAHARSLTR